MPKLTRLLVCGIAAAILTSPATPYLAWGSLREDGASTAASSSVGHRAHRIVEWFGHLAITGGRADITSGEGTWVSAASGRGLGCSRWRRGRGG